MARSVLGQTARNSEIPLTLSQPQDLLRFGLELHRIIARRAYQLYEERGRKPDRDIADWSDAEGEIVSHCTYSLVGSAGMVVFRAELPGRFTGEQVKVSIEPRRLIVAAQREVMVHYCSPSGHVAKPRLQRVFHIQSLPSEVDPSLSCAILGIERLEIVMPKAGSGRPSVEQPMCKKGETNHDPTQESV